MEEKGILLQNINSSRSRRSTLQGEPTSLSHVVCALLHGSDTLPGRMQSLGLVDVNVTLAHVAGLGWTSRAWTRGRTLVGILEIGTHQQQHTPRLQPSATKRSSPHNSTHRACR